MRRFRKVWFGLRVVWAVTPLNFACSSLAFMQFSLSISLFVVLFMSLASLVDPRVHSALGDMQTSVAPGSSSRFDRRPITKPPARKVESRG